MLSPEPPYPLQGGGAYRIASLLHYFARFAEVDLILISDSGAPALLPSGLVREQQVVPLPHHSRGLAARYVRNAGRAIRGVPPLIDRVSGLGVPIEQAIAGRKYDIRHHRALLVRSLHRSIEPLLRNHDSRSAQYRIGAGCRCAAVGRGLVRAGHLRFASASRKLEATLLPRFSMVLATSGNDAATARAIARKCTSRGLSELTPLGRNATVARVRRALSSPANFEYHPNIDAVACSRPGDLAAGEKPLSRPPPAPGRTRRRHSFAIFCLPAPWKRPESRSRAPFPTPGPRSRRRASWSRRSAPAAVRASRFWKRGRRPAVWLRPRSPPRDLTVEAGVNIVLAAGAAGVRL